MIDTLRLARRVRPGGKSNGLSDLLDNYGLREQVTRLAPDSRPHRALWDTIGVALLMTALIDDLQGGDTLTLRELRRVAGLPRTGADGSEPEQLPLMDL